MENHTPTRPQPRRKGTLVAISRLIPVLFVAGCSDAQVDLQHQIAALQKELERVRQEKTESKKNTPPSETASLTAPAALEMKILEKNLQQAADKFSVALEENLPGARIEHLTVSDLTEDSLQYPIRASVTFHMQIGGQSYTLPKVPAKANLAGKWVLPEAQSVAKNFKTRSESAERDRNDPQAGSTVKIQWDSGRAPGQGAGGAASADSASDARRSPQRGEPPQEASGGGGTPQRQRNSPVMPVQRDVEIKFK